MKSYFRSFAIAIVALTAAMLCAADSRLLESPGYSREVAEKEIRGRNDTGCIEVLEAKWGATDCSDPASLTIRAKVKCDRPVDIRICIKTDKGGWKCGNYSGKKTNDEVVNYECGANGSYTILKRDVGSNKAWPLP